MTRIAGRLCRFFPLMLLALMLGAAGAARAEIKWPSPIRIVVPFSPGGSNDLIARAIAPSLARSLGTAVIVENRPGAAGLIGAEAVARAPRDASALLLTSSSFLTAAATQSRLGFDPVASLAPVAMVAQGPMLLAVPGSAAVTSTDALLAAARAAPGELNYGTAGIGSIGHLATELLTADARIRMTHVPYKGASDAILGLGGGQIQAMISNYSSLAAQLKTGRVRAIGVTSAQPSPAFPDLAPIAKSVPGYAIDIWVGVFAPADTPAPLIEALNREINAIAASPALRTLLEPDGAVAGGIDAAAFTARIRQDFAMWKRITTERKLTIE